MALQIKLELEPAARGEHWDYYYAQEGDWYIEIHVPKGERPINADIHFEFAKEEG